MTNNGYEPTLAAALIAAQAAMPPVEPDSVNPHFKSKFVSLDHLIAKTRPVLNAHGLAISQSPTHIDGAPALETTIHHVSGERISTVMPLVLAKNDMQGLGGAITYARRYAWAAALGISADEDDDGEADARQARKAAPEATGAAQKAQEAQAKSAASPLATEAEIASYREAVEAAGFDWGAASKAFSDPPTRAEVDEGRAGLEAALARIQEKA